MFFTVGNFKNGLKVKTSYAVSKYDWINIKLDIDGL